MLKKGESLPPDHHQFKQCPQCGTIVPIYEVKHESKIQPFAEPVKNPFDIGTEILGTDSRATQRKKGKKRKSRFSYKHEDPDPEIQAAIDKGLAVNILYDSMFG